MRRILVILFLFSLLGCGNGPESPPRITGFTIPSIPAVTPTPEPEAPSQDEYPGVTIDQVFPLIHESSRLDDNGGESEQLVTAGRFKVRIKDYVPINLESNERSVFSFKQRQPDGYWGTLVGLSKLRGTRSEELYVVVSGPGGVCCTNYSVIDVSSKTPRSIFHSEDFGSFRMPMEIFDAEGDGVYELVQFDSCMRYFRDDCGSCSPEPRVYFKYRPDLRKYWPARDLIQDFVREGFERSETWLDEKYAVWQTSKDPGLQHDIRRSLIAHVADLLHVGRERDAWKSLHKYRGITDQEDRVELKRRLAGCKFYQALNSGK